MGLPAGARNRRIRIERSVGADDGLATVETWAKHCDRWAEKEDVSDGERWRADQVGGHITTRFRVLWDKETAKITPGMRIVYPISALTDRRQMFYDISGVKEIGTSEGIEITAAARNDLVAE